MYRIVKAQPVGLNIKQFVIEAPRIARKQRPGQFVILRLREKGERIPLTIKAADPEAGTVTIVVQGVGKTTSLLNCLSAGDSVMDIVGPLGKPSEIEKFGTVLILAGSVGTAMALPTAKALKAADNHVIFIEGARSREMVVFEDEVRDASNEHYTMTDDGTYGEKGLVTAKLNELLAAGRKIDFVLAVGPVPMMRAVSQITCPLGIRTIVSLNSIMVDGTGMCGGCRVLLGDKSKFACVDGPEFDASLVNFEVLMQRNSMYRDKECESLRDFEEHKQEELKQLREELAAKEAELEDLRADIAELSSPVEAHHA
ncbi:sulfide/dihydroorotate dehydrogenase-like FAD/NAD-binding protein [Occallatibacter savannae]|uniref:sulfide/dihydroorotate dehydrogenase-like FAD/NAD-binding protein n=1 Tax=Occallatibacter savannae TaxID=1002691 RepID=UPI000D688150|nr:sulfide/dihydroorotate dehydrogenase-like FAD/NAD-binding protein [Occallatibacter savannae]